MGAVSSSTRSHLMAEPSLFDMFGRTSPRIRPTLNSHSRMMEARLGKQTGLRHRRGCKMNLTKRTELRRIPDRGSHDWETINQILDAGFLASVGFCVDGQPFVIPTLYGRDGERRCCAEMAGDAKHAARGQHHKEFRSQSGNDSEQNLITLCTTCRASVHSPKFRR